MKKTLALALAAVMSLDLQRGDWDREKGQTICANDLAQYGDKIEVVFCNNDDMAIGALQSLHRPLLRGRLPHTLAPPGGGVAWGARTLPD